MNVEVELLRLYSIKHQVGDRQRVIEAVVAATVTARISLHLAGFSIDRHVQFDSRTFVSLEGNQNP